MTNITLAPHLQRALDAMSKDMGVEQQALVNQAVFAWLRTNGYTTTAAVAVTAPPAQQPEAPPPPPPPPAAPVVAKPVEPVRSSPTPAPVAPPPAAPVVAPAAQGVDVAPLLQRMAEIDADLEKLTRPWPAWAPVEEEEQEAEVDEEEAQEQEQEEEEQAEDEDAHPHPEPSPEGPEGRGEDVEENPFDDESEEGEGRTIVLKSSPLSLYIERKGYDPVKVDTDRFIIGRGPHCNMVIDSPRVSREHVALTRKGVLFLLEDLNSSNGTWLGEERIGLRELETGDVIKLGNEPVTFVIRAD
jgi:hypothetical protein